MVYNKHSRAGSREMVLYLSHVGAQAYPTDMSSSPLCHEEPPSLQGLPHPAPFPLPVSSVCPGDLTGPGRRDEGGSKTMGMVTLSQELLQMQSNDSAEDQGRAQGQTLSLI